MGAVREHHWWHGGVSLAKGRNFDAGVPTVGWSVLCEGWARGLPVNQRAIFQIRTIQQRKHLRISRFRSAPNWRGIDTNLKLAKVRIYPFTG